MSVILFKQDYDKNKVNYDTVEEDLKKILGDKVTINHVGSTAIPDMYGKNIIDVLVGVNKDQFNKVIDLINKKMGYHLGTSGTSDIYQFMASRDGETHDGDVHIHVVVKDTKRYDDFLVLKNYLLKNKKEAKDYSDFKKKIIASGNTERRDYKNIKGKYVDDLIKRAYQNK